MSTPSSSGTRERLVEEALALVDEVGVGGFTGREVARRAGVSHGAPRRYFPTLAALLSAVAARGYDTLYGRLRDLDDSRPADATDPDAARALLQATAMAYLNFAAERPGLFELMFRHDLLAGSGENLRTHSLPVLGLQRDRFVAALTDTAALLDPDQRALDLWAQMHGIAVLHSRRAFEVAGDLVPVPAPSEMVRRCVQRHLEFRPGAE